MACETLKGAKHSKRLAARYFSKNYGDLACGGLCFATKRGAMKIGRLGGTLVAATLGFGWAVACSSDDGQRVDNRESESAGGGGASGDDTVAGNHGDDGSSDAGTGNEANGGAGGAPSSSAGAGAGGEVFGGAAGSSAGEAGAGGTGEEPIDLGLLGCQEVSGARPASTGTPASPQVADLSLDASEPGEALSGSLAFQDSDPKELIVQVNGSGVHYVCPLSNDDLTAKVAQFSPLSLNPVFPEGERILYFGVRDAAGNVSAYLVGNLTVGNGGGGTDVCVAGQPIQLIGKVPSASTQFYQEKNGYSPDYSFNNQPNTLVPVASTRVHLSLGACKTLKLAGDAAGTKPLGWDNCLVVEYRPGIDGPLEKAWYYCNSDYGTVFSLATGQALPPPLKPTVKGTLLEPPVPSELLFGYPALALDLMSEVPNVAEDFELTLHVLDFGSVGSTTEVWAIAGGAP